MRNIVANKQTENKTLGYLVGREEALKETQTTYLLKSLRSLLKSLQAQLHALENGSDSISGRMTPYGMENLLQEKFQLMKADFGKFLEDSAKDVYENYAELEELRKDV